MRNFISYLISTFALLTLLSSCEREAKVIYAIGIDEPVVRCTHSNQERTITYKLHPNILSTDVNPNISVDASWVEIVDTSTLGEFTIKVEENPIAERSAIISISAKDCQTAKIELLQYGEPPAMATHTLMYCFMGTSLNKYFQTNIEDAQKAIKTGILGNSNRVIFFRQNSSTKGYIGEIYYDGTEIHHMDIDLSTSLMTPDKLGEIMATMADIAPAERYGIVLAGHGQAWITRDIINNNYQDISALGLMPNPWIQAPGAETTRAFGESNVQFNIEELAEALKLSAVELDYILFDACFMSNIETIYELRNLANYIIASPCEIMGRGFPYERTLPYLFENEGKESNYKDAAESYYKYYRDEVSGSVRCGSITVYDCSKIGALAEATKMAMVGAISREDRECRIDLMQTYEGQTPHHFFDFGQWINHIARDQEALENFNKAFKDCVIATFTLDFFYSAYGKYGTYPINLDVYSGVTTSAPSGAYPNGWRTTNWYKEVIALEN